MFRDEYAGVSLTESEAMARPFLKLFLHFYDTSGHAGTFVAREFVIILGDPVVPVILVERDCGQRGQQTQLRDALLTGPPLYLPVDLCPTPLRATEGST